MTGKSLPCIDSVFHIATEIEETALDLKTCTGLMENTLLSFTASDPEAVEQARAQLFFLVNALGPYQERLAATVKAAYDMAHTEKAAA